MLDPAETRVRAALENPGFVAGVSAGRWSIKAFAFPRLDFEIAATEPDGGKVVYGFRSDLSNFPATNPMVRIWNFAADAPLDVNLRPKGNQRVAVAFQPWTEDTVYRPWERLTGPHNGNATNFPQLAWRSDRPLHFIFEDLHGILNLNARAHRIRAAA